MSVLDKLSEDKYRVWIRWLSLISQITILILALVLMTNIATRQYNYAQMETIKVQMLDEMYKNKKDSDEKLSLLKEELSSYQTTREGRAKFFAEKVSELEQQVVKDKESFDRRINNLNSKFNYWAGKIKKSEIQDKLKNQ